MELVRLHVVGGLIFNFILADVSGSVEAVVNSLDSMGNEEVCVNVIDFGVGDINESDVTKASASKCKKIYIFFILSFILLLSLNTK